MVLCISRYCRYRRDPRLLRDRRYSRRHCQVFVRYVPHYLARDHSRRIYAYEAVDALLGSKNGSLMTAVFYCREL
jgi:hypothetical protein